MNKRRNIIVVIITVLIVISPMIYIASKTTGLTSFTIFADISECEEVFQKDIENANFEKYNTPHSDEYIKKLEYESFFAGKYSSDEFEFEIFAYEFKNSDLAKAYYKNYSGDHAPKNSLFGSRTSVFSYELIVVDYERAYTIYASTNDSKKVELFIHDAFSVEIDLTAS